MTKKILRLTLVYCFAISFLCSSCAQKTLQYKPVIDRPTQPATEEIWFKYYYDQMKAYGDRALQTNETASDEEKSGYNRALEEWRKYKLKQYSKSVGKKAELQVLGYLAGFLVAYIIYASQ